MICGKVEKNLKICENAEKFRVQDILLTLFSGEMVKVYNFSSILTVCSNNPFDAFHMLAYFLDENTFTQHLD